MWFPNRSDTNQAVQSLKQARDLKFWLELDEELHYPSSKNKGADQLRGYREGGQNTSIVCLIDHQASIRMQSTDFHR